MVTNICVTIQLQKSFLYGRKFVRFLHLPVKPASLILGKTKRVKKAVVVACIIAFTNMLYAQHKGYTTVIEPCACPFVADSSLKTTCAYLIVPESRLKPTGKTIKLPFIYVKKGMDKKRDAVLYTSGGPGNSSLRAVRNVHRRGLMKNHDFIAFEQRGTQYALPSLPCPEIGAGFKDAYKYNLPKDSMLLAGVKRCRQRLMAKGNNLAAYNTEESAADIEDLREALHIDSLNLMGISYSGGLVLTVLHNYPAHIRSLLLDSPLPEFINIDEEEILNFNEALNTIFGKCETDSTDKVLYDNMKQRFQQYFTAIGNKVFTIAYKDKNAADTLYIEYTRNELLAVLENAMFDFSKIKDVPFIITQLIAGNHQPYITQLLDGIFSGNSGPSGMRLSVYCSDKMAYADKKMIETQFTVYPYVQGAGYFINDVNDAMCSCWQVPPVSRNTKKPFYANTPVLLAAGDTDPSCRPLYNDMLQHYMPNAQRLLFINRSHGPMLNTREGDDYITQFINHPFKRIENSRKDVLVY